MITSIFRAFKNFLGLDSTKTDSRKRPHQDARSDYPDDISTDEETDFENITASKRRKLETDQHSDDMANWIRPPKGFTQNFIFSKQEKSFDALNRESFEKASIKPNHKPTEKTMLTSDSQSKTLSLRSQSYQNCNNENNENKYSRKTPQFKRLDNSTSQCSNSMASLTNGFHQSFNQTRDHDGRFHSSSLAENNSFKRLTVSRCTQIEEKEKYRQLLNRYPQPFTPIYGNDSLSLRHTSNHSLNSGPSSSRRNSVTKEKLSEVDKQQRIQRFLQSDSSTNQTPSANRLSSPVNEDSLMRKSPKSEKSPYSHKTVAGVSQSSSKRSASQVKRWKLKSDELNCPYTDKNWLEKWKIKLKNQEVEKKQQIAEARKRIDALSKPWEKEYWDLEKNIKDQLSIAEKQAEVLEEIYATKDDKDLLEDDQKKPMPELTPEMEKKIDDALRPKPPNEVLVDKFQIPIHRRDMETLQDLNWLNDAIINFYMNLLMERGKLDNFPSVYACNTFFYPKLISGGHAALKRWTRRIDIFSYDIMLVPVHLEVHWCLAVVDFRNKMIKYYDSMGGKNNECLNALSTYLQDECLDKKKQTLSMDDWTLKNVSNAPKQKNSSDCGMFACKYAEYITRDAKLTFKQNHMPYFRRRMVYEILTTQLL